MSAQLLRDGNRSDVRDDHLCEPTTPPTDHLAAEDPMTQPHPGPDAACTSVTEAISARLDGEPHPLSPDEVARHVTSCAACSRFESAAAEVADHTRSLGPVPDLAPTILAALTEDHLATDRRRVLELRWLVALAGTVQLVFALPGLLGAELHVGRDLGALQLALGVGFVLAAWQPQRSAGVLPIAAVVAVVAVGAAAIDVTRGVASPGAEFAHLAEVVGVLALWGLRRRVPSGPPSIRAAVSMT